MARTASGEHTDSVAEPPPPRTISAATPIALGLALSSLFGVVGVAYAAGVAHNRIENLEKTQVHASKTTEAKEKETQDLRTTVAAMQTDLTWTRAAVDRLEKKISNLTTFRPVRGGRDE